MRVLTIAAIALVVSTGVRAGPQPSSSPPVVGKPSAAPPASPSPKPYSGLGASSVSAETLAKFAPPALPRDIAERIQTLLDVRSPGGGQPANDGKRLFFTWSVTGSRQIWRLDGPDHFPVQVTGGEDTTTIADIARDNSFLVVRRDRNGEENPACTG